MELFEAQVAQSPEAIAVVYEENAAEHSARFKRLLEQVVADAEQKGFSRQLQASSPGKRHRSPFAGFGLRSGYTGFARAVYELLRDCQTPQRGW